MSAPAIFRSVSRTPRSAPRAIASRRTSSAIGGPIVIAVISPPAVSLIRRAASRAERQAGFIIPSARSRWRVPVAGSQGSSETIGTCLMQTTIFSIGSYVLWASTAREMTIRWTSLVPS